MQFGYAMYHNKNSFKINEDRSHHALQTTDSLSSQALRPLGLYIHFPYCSQRCPYCDFTLTTTAVPHEDYLQACLNELDLRQQELDQYAWSKRPLTSLYFGGGTPSLWSPQCLKAFIDHCAQVFGFHTDIEITIEANPAEVTLPLLHAWSELGINRISLGVQSMRINTLKRLGRDHSPEQVKQVVEWIRLSQIKQFSVDLIHGLSGEGVNEALEDLEAVLALSPQHISLYQLTIEEKTSFGLRTARGEKLLEPDETLIDIYRALSQRLEQEGMSLYEVSNASLPNHEAKHNSLYWTMADYIGIGTGAHGRIIINESEHEPQFGLRWQNIRLPQKYIEHCLTGLNPLTKLDAKRLSVGQKINMIEEERGHIDQEGLNEEAIMVGLRLKRGLSLTPELINRYGKHAQKLTQKGLLTHSPACSEHLWGRWQSTERGRELLNHLCYKLILG